MCRTHLLTEVRGIQVLIKKITYFIVELSYFMVFFVISVSFVYLGHRKQWHNVVYELSAVKSDIGVRSLIQSAMQNHRTCFFFI
jgi:hypothetical protein